MAHLPLLPLPCQVCGAPVPADWASDGITYCSEGCWAYATDYGLRGRGRPVPPDQDEDH